MGFQKVTHTLDVYRLTRSGNNEQYDLSPVYSGIECGIFPASPDVLAVYPGESSFALFEIYIYENVALKNGDKLKYGSVEWIIRGVPQVYDTNQLFYVRAIGEQVVGS